MAKHKSTSGEKSEAEYSGCWLPPSPSDAFRPRRPEVAEEALAEAHVAPGVPTSDGPLRVEQQPAVEVRLPLEGLGRRFRFWPGIGLWFLADPKDQKPRNAQKKKEPKRTKPKMNKRTESQKTKRQTNHLPATVKFLSWEPSLTSSCFPHLALLHGRKTK